jgi:pimeloyl-ACP methyl ester carboxylesterase
MPPVSPAPVPVRSVPSSDGVVVALHDLGGDGPPVLLAHPTGFLAMTWAPLAAEMAALAHCWALDFRGHGDATAPASGDFAWTGMADDVLAVVDDLAAAGAAGPGLRAAGHSMGGAALLMAEQRRPGTFGALWLYEPIVPPWSAGGPPPAGTNVMADVARRRRPWFPDRAAAYENFKDKPPLSLLAPGALAAYVDHGLRERDGDGDASVELKCLPETEARVFDGARGHDAYDRLGEVACAVTVAIGGDETPPASFGPALAEALPHGRLERHPELSHFGPMQDPAAMALSVRAALDLG